MELLRVTIPGLTCVADLNAPVGTPRLVDFDGWTRRPSIVADVEKRSESHGVHRPLNPTYGARYPTLIADLHTEPGGDIRTVYGPAIEALTLNDMQVEVEDPDGIRYITAMMVEAGFEMGIDPCIGRLTIEMMAADPLKYSAPVIQSGTAGSPMGGGMLFPAFDETGFAEFTERPGANRVFVPNDGKEESWPELRVTGPLSWFRFVSGGRVVEFTRPVTVGQTVRLDTAAEMAWIGNSDVSGHMTADSFFPIAPGGQWVQFFADADAAFEIESRSAWL